MSKLRVHSFSISLDGFGAGPEQSLQNPLGAGGLALHQWAFDTRTFHARSNGEEEFVTALLNFESKTNRNRISRP